MKLLVTGGAGFIGQNIIEQLGGEYSILAPNHSELDLTDADRVYDYLSANPVDLVIHAANVGGSRKSVAKDVALTNLKFFFNLIRAKKFFGRMINFGSGAEYDKRRPLANAKEADFDKSVPVDEYGFYKYVTAKFAQNVNFITHLRLFGVYGKYEDQDIRFISNAVCRALLGEPITIKQNVKFDYLYINDFIRILKHFIDHAGKHKFYNIGRGEAIELKTISEKVKAMVKADVSIEFQTQGFGKEYTCDTSLLREEIPDFKFTDFDESLNELTGYYKKILSTLNKQSILKMY